MLMASLLIAAPAGCGSHGGTSGVSTAAPEGFTETGYLRLRWFPVQNAESYYLQVEGGGTLLNEEIRPNGCTHKRSDGYTSGVCEFDFKKPGVSESVAIQLGARTEHGTTNPALLRYRPN
jgi:hypothetical protein